MILLEKKVIYISKNLINFIYLKIKIYFMYRMSVRKICVVTKKQNTRILPDIDIFLHGLT